MRLLATNSVAAVLEGIERALRLVEPPAADVQELECAYLQLLTSVCSLTDEEANLVEPAFTALEEQFPRCRSSKPVVM